MVMVDLGIDWPMRVEEGLLTDYFSTIISS